MVQIGAQASTVKQAFVEHGPYATLARLAGLGYRSIELSQVAMTPENVAEVVRARTDHGVSAAALSAMLAPMPGYPFDSLEADFDKIVADCRTVGTDLLRLGMLPLPATRSLETLLEFAADADAMAVRLADEGIALYYHNHHVEFARYDGRLMLDVIADAAPHVGLELDVHWIQRGGMDPVAVLARYAGRVRLVHLKDYRIARFPAEALTALAGGDLGSFQRAFTDLVQFAEVGEGTLDWPAIIGQAIESGAEHLLVEQDETYGRDPFESLAISRANLVALGFGDLF